MMPLRCAIAFWSVSLAAGATALAGHPPITLRDQQGKNVLDSARPISTVQSCGRCHDTRYIATHSYHVALGSDETAAPGAIPSGRAWDWSPGPLGRWDPLTYRYLAPPGDARHDRDLAEWVSTYPRHVGGGPAQCIGLPKADGVEMNCFLCHTPKPDNETRLKELQQGRFDWANTATLASTGLIRPVQGGWAYQRQSFMADGSLQASRLGIREARSENCGLCHGLTDRGEQPLRLDLSLRQWSTATEGQVFSPQRICESAVNLRDKEHLTRAWDVHAERLLECASCHFSINNPAFSEPKLGHLKFEPRRLAPGQYLEQPSHQFARGHTSPGGLGHDFDGTMRRCEDCHTVAGTHDWLPYRQSHFARLSCEACHISQVYAPAVRQVDWTLLTPSGQPRIEWRGIEGDPADPTAEVTGFRPVLLPVQGLDGRSRLVPHNLIAAWYWVEGGQSPRPVRLADLKAALFQDGKYYPDVAHALAIGRAVLDTPDKVEAVRRRLKAVGVVDPQIEADVEPHALHHGVGPAKWAIRQCETCHAADSRLSQPFKLASYMPGGVLPKAVGGSELSGDLQSADRGLTYRPSTRQAALYVLGHNRWPWVNALGGFSLLAVVVGVVLHAGLRIRVAQQRKKRGSPPSHSASRSPRLPPPPTGNGSQSASTPPPAESS